MKKILFTTMLAVCSLSMQAQFSGQGSGTERDPYQITNADELFDVRSTPSAYYKLMNDIDLSAWIQDDNPKNGWNPIGTFSVPFSGHFDGNNKIIEGLYINRPSVNYIGLFGYVKGATIKNVCLVNPVIYGGSSVGAICGEVYAHTVSFISNNICIGGSVNGGSYVGGIIGRTYSGTDYTSNTSNYSIDYYIQGNYSSSIIHGKTYCGGIAGEVESWYLRYYSAGTYTVYADFNLRLTANVIDNHFAGTIYADDFAGGIVGQLIDSGSIPNSRLSNYLRFSVMRNLTGGSVFCNGAVGGIVSNYVGYSYGENEEVLINNVCYADTLSGNSIYGISPKSFQNNAIISTIAFINSTNYKTVEWEESGMNGSALGMRMLKRKNTYSGMGFDFLKQWNIVEEASFPFNKYQSEPGKIEEFVAGNRAKISGTANGPGKVFVIINNNCEKTPLVDGKWELTTGKIQPGEIAKVAIVSDGMMPSLFVEATATTAPLPPPTFGDANGDGVVDSADVTAIINYILGKPSSSFNKENADVTGDGEILIDDAVQTVQMIMDAQ